MTDPYAIQPDCNARPTARGTMPRPDWSRPRPRPLVIPTVLNLVTLDDVRALIERHLPMRIRELTCGASPLALASA
jgi:hypothetical protein